MEHRHTADPPDAHGGSVHFLVLPQLEAPSPMCFSRSSGVPANLDLGPHHVRAAPAGPGGEGAREAPATLTRLLAGQGARSHKPQPSGRAGVRSHRPGTATHDLSPPRGGPAAGPAIRPFPWPRRPSWRRLKTAQPRFENSSPFPPPPDGSREPPLATTPGAQNAP